MMKRIPWLALLLALGAAARAAADQDATYRGPISTSETTFVTAIASDLMARYPTAADAEKAGYVRYTAEDDTGAISYANQQWQSADIRHPSQLWYDKNGRLLGADYSVLVSNSSSRPQLWGVNPGRWVEFDGHVHWVAKDPATGQFAYDQWAWDKIFVAAGGNLDHPAAYAGCHAEGHLRRSGRHDLPLSSHLGPYRLGEAQSERRVRVEEPSRQALRKFRWIAMR